MTRLSRSPYFGWASTAGGLPQRVRLPVVLLAWGVGYLVVRFATDLDRDALWIGAVAMIVVTLPLDIWWWVTRTRRTLLGRELE